MLTVQDSDLAAAAAAAVFCSSHKKISCSFSHFLSILLLLPFFYILLLLPSLGLAPTPPVQASDQVSANLTNTHLSSNYISPSLRIYFVTTSVSLNVLNEPSSPFTQLSLKKHQSVLYATTYSVVVVNTATDHMRNQFFCK